MSIFFSPGRPKRALRAAAGGKSLLLSILLCLGFSYPLLAAQRKPTAARLSAAQIVKKHVSARGGLQAWRAVTKQSLGGTVEGGSWGSVSRCVHAVRRQGDGAQTESWRLTVQ